MTKPKVVVFTARGARSWTSAQRRRLERVGDVRWIQAPRRLAPAVYATFVRDAVVVGTTPRATPPLTATLLRQCPSWREAVVPTTGTEWLDAAAFENRGIRLTNVPGFSTDSAAEFAWTLLLALVRRLVPAHLDSRSGRRGDWKGMELRGKTLGIIGMGAIGRRVAGIARGFGMRVLATDPRPFPSRLATSVSRETALGRCDVLSLHAPLNARTRHLVNATSLRRLKPGAFLVNSARPALVDSRAVFQALRSGRLGGYAYDRGYLPASAERALVRHPRVLAVPHISWYTAEAVARESEQWLAALEAACRRVRS